eukprot:scaffold4423_cov344-Prasinococcus_capsulatus_cf.AAC.8
MSRSCGALSTGARGGGWVLDVVQLVLVLLDLLAQKVVHQRAHARDDGDVDQRLCLRACARPQGDPELAATITGTFASGGVAQGRTVRAGDGLQDVRHQQELQPEQDAVAQVDARLHAPVPARKQARAVVIIVCKDERRVVRAAVEQARCGSLA